MDAKNFDVEALRRMAHSPVRNYAIPGLTSWLIGSPSMAGTMRIFECERDHQEPIAPHSHRFDFQCWMLEGTVRNRLWKRVFSISDSDLYRTSILHYSGDIGSYKQETSTVDRWQYSDAVYKAGDCYSMKAHEVHSIFFARKTLVLFFEGPTIADTSIALEPHCYGDTVPTFRVEPWMFKRQ